MFNLETLKKNIEECRTAVEAGVENPSTLKMLIDTYNDLKDEPPESLDAYNELSEHLPNEGQDVVLIVLKGQLLIEKLVRRFIVSRMSNPKVFESQSFTAAQCIAIAQSMCLDNEEPNWLWAQVKEVNNIRNKLAHSLVNENIDKRIENFISTVSNREKLHSKSITGVLARLYGMLKGLCEVAESEEFRLYKKYNKPLHPTNCK